MQVSFERTGGFAGMRLSTVVDSHDLEKEEQVQLEEEIRQADFFHLPAHTMQPGGVDRFEYQITVDWGDLHHSVTVGETGMPESLRPLVQHLERLLRTYKKGQ